TRLRHAAGEPEVRVVPKDLAQGSERLWDVCEVVDEHGTALRPLGTSARVLASSIGSCVPVLQSLSYPHVRAGRPVVRGVRPSARQRYERAGLSCQSTT